MTRAIINIPDDATVVGAPHRVEEVAAGCLPLQRQGSFGKEGGLGSQNTKMTQHYQKKKNSFNEGTLVSQGSGEFSKVSKLGACRVRLSAMATRPKNRIRLFVEDMLKHAPDCHPATGEPLPARMNLSLGDPTALGLKPPREATDALVSVASDSSMSGLTTKEVHGYQHSLGNPRFREAIRTHALQGTGIAGVDDIFVTSGCSQALQFALLTLCTDGESNVLIPSPCFPLYNTLCEFVGAEARGYQLNPSASWEARMEDLEKQCDAKTACLLVCNPGNPTSHAYSADHLEQLLKFAYRKRIPVVADEVYAHMTFDLEGEGEGAGADNGAHSNGKAAGKARFQYMAEVAFERLGRERPPILSCSALSKRFLVPGWRLGWLSLYDDAFESLKQAGVKEGVAALCQIGMTPSSITQAAAPAILANTPDQYHADLRATIKRGAKYCVERCRQCPGLDCVYEPQGAMYFMPRVDAKAFAGKLGGENPKGESADIVWTKALLAERNVFMLPGTLFGAPDFARIVTAAPREVLCEAWDRIESFCREKLGQ